jgi:hypothetical protein
MQVINAILRYEDSYFWLPWRGYDRESYRIEMFPRLRWVSIVILEQTRVYLGY